MQIGVEGGRVISLEALRGLAAIVVVVWHSMLAFSPWISGIFPSFSVEESYNGNPLFVFINGGAAVVLFFVLSGFVLSRNAFIEKNSVGVVVNAVKRYPRLVVPVLTSVLFSWLIFKIGAYRFNEAAAISGSPWLAKFGYAYSAPFPISFIDALKQGLFLNFFKGDTYYNSSLWTMRYEFYASFAIFSCTLLLLEMRKFGRWVPLYFFCLLFTLAVYVSFWYIPFFAGLFIAYALPNDFDFSTVQRKSAAVMGIAVALYLLGYNLPIKFYSYWAPFNPVVVNTVGSCILISIANYWRVPSSLSKLFIWLGKISFPLYVIHLPIICSLNSGMYLLIIKFELSSFVSVIFSVASSILCAIPLIWLNSAWLSTLSRIFPKNLICPPKI